VFKNIEKLKIEDINRGVSNKTFSVSSRKTGLFVLRMTGHVRYFFDDYAQDVHADEIIFLPKGCSYNFLALTDAPCEYISIRIDAELENPKISVHSLEHFQEIDEFKNNLTDLWKFGGQNERYKCYSVFYNMLAYLEGVEHQSYSDKKNLNIISPAVSYLKKHIYDCDLKIETLHNLCGISGTYFRKIFEANFAASPQKYISGKRLSRAKSIIDNGDFDTVSEVANSVGYSDPLYFSRAFKKAYGISPSQYAKT
jgi:AraC-like DNA-binding protein